MSAWVSAAIYADVSPLKGIYLGAGPRPDLDVVVEVTRLA